MSSRYPTTPRDRSPPRYDRRPSGTYPAPGSSYRGYQFSSAPRGRGGFPARAGGDTWDRDRDRDRDRDHDRDRDRDRDVRGTPQSYRARDDDRPEWQRRDRDFPPADRNVGVARDSRTYVGRERSASPARPRRDSRDSLPSTFSRTADSAASFYTPAQRGGLGRGRGRDWERIRRRTSLVGERDRDLFRPRSRSRESWRDRDYDRGRPSAPDPDRADRFERREFNRSRERDIRGRDRDPDIRPRDSSPARSVAGHTTASGATPPASTTERLAKADYDTVRKQPPINTPSTSLRDPRRDGDSSDYFGSRPDPSRRDPPQGSQQPSTAVGLDYGPPPSLPPASTPVSERPPAPKPAQSKADLNPTSSTPFQPPSGPKAARTPTATTPATPLGPKLVQAQDTWSRNEPHQRTVRPTPPPPASNSQGEGAAKKEQPSQDSRPSPVAPIDRALPANIPSGPRLGTAAPPFRARLSSMETSAQAGIMRDGLKSISIDSKTTSIPTGPRLDRDGRDRDTRLDRDGPRPPPGTGSKIWVSPDYKPKPSIMNQMNKPYPSDPRDRAGFIPSGPRQQSGFHGQMDKSRALQNGPTSVPSAPTGPKALLATSPRIPEAKITLIPRPPIDVMRASDDVEMSVPASSEDEDDAEDDAFDDDYFAESEDRFKQEMDLLEARKPAPVLQDGTIVSLLIRLQFLEMIVQDAIPQPASALLEPSKAQASVSPDIPPALPSPDADAPNLDAKLVAENVMPRGRPLKQPPVNPIPTPPIEELPYLRAQLPEPVLFEESDNEVEHEAVAMLLQQEFEHSAWDWRSEMEDLHMEYRKSYPAWKHEFVYLDVDRRDQQASPAPASPAPSAAPSVTPSLGHERTRGARNTTEADLQAAILMSQQSLKEEEERREREAASSSLPNLDTEAVIPAMLKPQDVEASYFEDTNRLINVELTLEFYEFLPPVDDFTEEEQTLFITAYCQSPKKWGKIAESIPGRSYHECIAHYYLTKTQTPYKDIWRRSQPRKRRGRGAGKPRATALMSELGDGEDGEGASVPVTESGRPRRAAAPTFGDVASENDTSTPGPQSRKPGHGPKDGSVEPTAAKPTRGRKTGIATKTRRTKAQIQADQQAQAQAEAFAQAQAGTLADAQAQAQAQAMAQAYAQVPEASQLKPAPAAKPERARTLLRAENVPIRSDPQPASQAARLDGAAPPHIATDAMPPSTVPPPATSQVTSYWSVPEQNKFPELLQYFGRDYAAIADFMKTKSVTMIKNYYLRQVNAEGKEEFKRLEEIGEQMRLSGTRPAQPPSPIAPAKRRYEAAPSVVPVVRPPVVHGVQPDRSHVDTEPATASDNHPRDNSDRNTEVLQNRPAPRDIGRDSVPAALNPQPKIEELSKTERSSLYGPKSLHGPKPGVFQEDPLGYHGPRQPLRMPLQEHSPHVQHQRLSDPNLPSALSNMPQGILGHSRELIAQPLQRSHPPSGPFGPTPQSQAEKYHATSMHRPDHSRNSSSTGPGHSLLEPPQELARRFDSQPRSSLFGSRAGPSPSATPSLTSAPPNLKAEAPISQPASAPPLEQPKPPAKRSNLFGLLNDDAPEPPPKRPSLEAPRRTSLLSPQTNIGGTTPALSRGQGPPDDALQGRSSRGPYGSSGSGIQPSSGHSLADYQNAYNELQSTTGAPANENWLDRYDPRTQGQSEQRSLHQSPRPSPYSLIPPSAQSNTPSVHPLRDPNPLQLEAKNSIDHRRSLLGSLNQVPPAPSPPPQATPQANQPFRTVSGGGHHSRVSSVGYPPPQTASPAAHLGHQQPLHQPGGTAMHPQSTSSTPVSSLHQRASSNSDFQPRLTIQQHMAQKQQEQQREQERQMHRQREVEAVQRDREREQRERDLLSQHQQQQQQQQQQQHHHHQQQQQQQQQPQQQQQQQHVRRDIWGSDHHSSPSIARPSPMGTSGTPSHLGYGQREIPRTFTPPHQHSHSPYGGSGLGVQHHQSGLPSMQAKPQAPNQAPSQPGGPPATHPIHHRLQHPSSQLQGQGLHAGNQLHFRHLSQNGEPRRDERR
ncbi:hypothetical protein PV10_08147 [Exophiala mesophila]|uniref:SANT domain-containing protein n=1 Tax=Exophiala mesophila TaxID=212818 RepID=A0A0D1Z3J8_EXOME|nr:uncharacterized protein PV10_08147 [Exophiala mesophila]KIV88464.1 hypothetical protein PV10_08147 [Exophiala mesophila]